MRYFFHMGYKGTLYRGWQRQPNQPNVQEVVENALTQILKVPAFATGCGRTDAQVHASQFFFHTDIDAPWNFDLPFRLNKTLPPDIAVFDIIPVEENQHARHNAIHRSYDYFIHTYKDPFLSESSSLYLERNLDVAKMKMAASLFTRYNDYKAFCRTPADYKHTLCKVTSATLFSDASGSRLRFKISSNRFLRKMIRTLVGKLLEIGRNELSMEELEHHLITREPFKALEPAHPQGLYLSKVTYRFLDLPPRPEFSLAQNQADQWREV
jgi:tRNA pseudouridine38-40 synthase